MQDEAGIDIVFVGDSVGPMFSAIKTRRSDDGRYVHHLKAVRRGVTDAYLLVDMPYAADRDVTQAITNAKLFVSDGADGVIIGRWCRKVLSPHFVSALTEHGIDTCAHIGHNPQIHGTKASTHGRTFAKAKQLIEAAEALSQTLARNSSSSRKSLKR
ncbi:3-methyl-2-oxobutanoate hydroxymethyltransferase [Geodia barretti]|uniref:3-methyl-2-oxobutanoate hydroxymethyltransferase n=1 Tax=Geodia barretti TaxID=519541 RepID=A0AA35SG13_GEOBA|nr:3-methyl-2-oxobutanoate hydroxymethyltransferase [Geodia barretti]